MARVTLGEIPPGWAVFSRIGDEDPAERGTAWKEDPKQKQLSQQMSPQPALQISTNPEGKCPVKKRY
jgi:hypothetical protein